MSNLTCTSTGDFEFDGGALFLGLGHRAKMVPFSIILRPVPTLLSFPGPRSTSALGSPNSARLSRRLWHRSVFVPGPDTRIRRSCVVLLVNVQARPPYLRPFVSLCLATPTASPHSTRPTRFYPKPRIRRSRPLYPLGRILPFCFPFSSPFSSPLNQFFRHDAQVANIRKPLLP